MYFNYLVNDILQTWEKIWNQSDLSYEKTEKSVIIYFTFRKRIFFIRFNSVIFYCIKLFIVFRRNEYKIEMKAVDYKSPLDEYENLMMLNLMEVIEKKTPILFVWNGYVRRWRPENYCIVCEIISLLYVLTDSFKLRTLKKVMEFQNQLTMIFISVDLLMEL